MNRYCEDRFQVEGTGSDNRVTARVSIPDVDWFKRQFVGLLTTWSRSNAWVVTDDATITLDTALEYVAEAIGSLMIVSEIGKLEFYLVDDPSLLPPHVLPMDGNLRNKDDYPQLWDVLPTSLKTSTTFTLPLMAGRYPIGAGESEYGETFEAGSGYGTNEVSLTVGNLAEHYHSDNETGIGVSLEGAGAPIPAPTLASPSITGSTGSGDPFDILPPSMAGYWGIIAL